LKGQTCRITAPASVADALGSNVTARVDNDFDSLTLAEQILASLEALLATATEDVFPHAEEFAIRVIRSASAKGEPNHKFEDGEAEQVLTITRAGGWSSKASVSPSHGEWLKKLVLEIALRIVFVRDIQAYGEQVFGREAGFGRAINFSDTATPLKNILGDNLQLNISEWQIPGEASESFSLRRDTPWYEGLDHAKSDVPFLRIREGAGDGEPPQDMPDFAAVRHKERRVFSLINVPLWEKAEWAATMYIVNRDYMSEPPILGVAFKNSEAGRAIFTGLRSRVGRIDEEEQLHISIITEISKSKPFAYGVVIGSNPAVGRGAGFKYFIMGSRQNKMYPTDSANLDRFLTRFRSAGAYSTRSCASAGWRESHLRRFLI
jgi:hypothetical protein